MANGTISAGKNINFLLGTQNNLEKYIAGTTKAADGTFYLTNDTHRLYIGTSDGKAVPVNEGVITVASLDALAKIPNPHAGEFYYVTAENILCVYNGSTWVQINNNTNTYIVDSNLTVTAANNVATVTKQYIYNDNTVAEKVTIPWHIAGVDGIKVTADDATDTITLTGVLNDKFTVAVDNNKAIFSLHDTFGRTKDFSVKSTDGRISVTKDTDDGIIIGVLDMYNTGVDIVNGSADGFTVHVTDGKGTVSGSFSPTITVGTEATTKQTLKFVNGNADLPVYTKAEIDSLQLALNAMTYRGLVAASADSTQNIQAWSTVMKAKAQIGDTYLFALNTTFTPTGSTKSVTRSAGSLVIARGVEDSTGYIPAGQVIWDYVEATNDTDTRYEFNGQASTSTSDGYIQLLSTLYGYQGGATALGKKLIFTNGTEIKANVTVDADGNTTVQFNHDTHNASNTQETQTQGTAYYRSGGDVSYADTQITTIKGITVNAQGHVTGFTTNTVTLKDTNATVAQVALTGAVSNAGAKATLTSLVQLNDGSGTTMTEKTGAMEFTTGTLQYSMNGTALNIDLVWGSFN